MVSRFLNVMLIIWKRFSTRFNSILQRSNSIHNKRLDTIKDLRQEKNETKQEFMYLNKKICSDSPDQNRQFQNSDNQKKYHLLSPQ